MAGKTRRILIVEDTTSHAELIQREFENRIPSALLTVAHTVREARAALDESIPDLVISDLYLPDGSGIELLPANGQDAAYPLVIMTAQGAEQDAVEAMKAGALDYVVKSTATLSDLPRTGERAMREWEHIVQSRLAIQALRESEEQYRILLENHVDGVSVVIDGKIVYANDPMCSLVGYGRHEILGRSPIEFLAPADRRRAAERIAALMNGEDEFASEYEIQRQDGSNVVVEISSRAIRYDGQSALLSVMRDVTARKQAEQQSHDLEVQMQHAQKLESLGVLAGGIAHDFNNLLMGVLGHAGLARTDVVDGSPLSDNLEKIETAAHRAADLCQQLLAYSGRGQFIVEPLNLNGSVNEITKLLETVISKRARLTFNLAADLPMIEADASQISQILMNLITNASDAVHEKSGVVTISTGVIDADQDDLSQSVLKDNLPAGRYVCLEVSDTGCGMDEETMAKIFDPFFTTKFTGRGLGLAAALGIVRGHRGAIEVSSQPGHGTTFRVLFPATDKQAAPTSHQTPPEQIDRGQGTILIADDEEIVRTVVVRVLERAGFQVLAARDGREAIDLFESHRDEISAVLLDLTMPKLNGDDTFQELRRLRIDVPVILSSGYDEQDASHRFGGRELAGFLKKPYQPHILIETVRNALARKVNDAAFQAR